MVYAFVYVFCSSIGADLIVTQYKPQGFATSNFTRTCSMGPDPRLVKNRQSTRYIGGYSASRQQISSFRPPC